MKKLIKKINKVLSLPATNIVVGILLVLSPVYLFLTNEFQFISFFYGFGFALGLVLISEGIVDIVKKKKAADQEKTGH